MSELKLLVCGDIIGQLDQIYTKIKVLLQKHDFRYLFCVGKFCRESLADLSPYIDGQLIAPIKTYFISTPEEYDIVGGQGEICPNIYHLTGLGLIELDELTVCYISGPLDRISTDDVAAFSEKVDSLQGTDILLSNEWPLGVLSALNVQDHPKDIPMTEFNSTGEDLVAEIVSVAAPRYHFASSNTANCGYYERPPYRNGPQVEDGKKLPCTRFISLAECLNSSKQKFLYALSIIPATQMGDKLFDEPGYCSSFPLTKYEKKSDERSIKRRTLENGNETTIIDSPRDDCWFCLSNPNVETHLVVSVGTHFYLAMAKGGMNEYHILIISISHTIASSIYLSQEAEDEMEQWKESLKAYFDSMDLYPIYFEHYAHRKGSANHFHIQVVPIPKTYSENQVSSTFENVGRNYNMKFNWSTYYHFLSESVGLKESYFFAEIENKKMVCRLRDKIPFSFGREVMATLLDCPAKVDWKSCQLPKNGEIRLTTNFRNTFKSFDFTRN